ncbi:putative acetyltransferase involved in intracellular survival and related acetyltransferase [Rubrobacter radiotolerans]|uniref:GNAT family N-acetyltransferase n=1 Tax=Rubrobacter radiotolerans TaxID=42256 RepID=A0A023X7F7_RUBRA|nr:GNAT family N-acetyltransferase [Rubrobacter radiotolerans]AHY47970.1 putative acetyltransferase involved in intracellular survival and related acetyltransferase [Rubrobacter radiotolerans]MDX5892608.1 GNAT family N-acetyltransferase [Rubrobacter radiotolerans]SMC07920.1 Predicted acetyltransferase [Rubrobacter radiotolerans DSM 5868]
MKVRSYTPDDRDALARMMTLAFGGSIQESREYYKPQKNPVLDPEQVFVIEEDGEPRASATVLPLRAWVDGEDVPLGGVSAVYTHPASRRRGHAGALVRTLLRDLRERDVHLSTLWPFEHAFYRAYGYELASESIRYRVTPAKLPKSEEQRNVRPHRSDDLEGLIRAFEGQAPRYQLCVRRGEGVWKRLLRRGKEGWEFAVHERGLGIEGYAFYRHREKNDEDGPSRTLEVAEIVTVTREARAGLLSFMASYNPEEFTVRLATPRGEPLHPYLESSHVGMELEPEFMLRLVDVEGALGHLRREVPEPLVLEVSDDGLPENAGEFTLGTGEVVRGAEAERRVELDVRRLAQLYAGYLGARDLAEQSLVRARDGEALELLEALFPTGEPWVYPTDHF